MICKIAGLGVEVPNVGNLAERCKAYLAETETDIVLEKEELRHDHWEKLSEEDNYYMDSGFQFYRKLLDFDGLMLHSSCVVADGYAYLFSGPCGMGKSTHTAKYLKAFPDAVIINDDKPALRRIDGKWYAYGTPWCGKDGINENMSAPIAGICFLHRGDTQLKRLGALEAAGYVLRQTTGRRNPEMGKKLMRLVNLLVTEVPVFEFYNHADDGAEMITYNAMRLANDFTL
ncbi:MAG: hypothetical protein Q4E35_04610 [Eubacteriales bacterium]|nr:hypothetical protein [Eubacteriales bacterium]